MFGVRSSGAADRRLHAEGQVIRFEVSRRLITHARTLPGRVCLNWKSGETGELFVGDTLFAGSIGRTDLPGGDYDILIKSIQTVLFAFGDAASCIGPRPDDDGQGASCENPFLIAP